MPASVSEPLKLVEIRLGPEHHKYGDPYEWSCTGLVHEDGCIELRLVDKPLPRGGRAEVTEALQKAGFHTVWWTREQGSRKLRQTSKFTRRKSDS